MRRLNNLLKNPLTGIQIINYLIVFLRYNLTAETKAMNTDQELKEIVKVSGPFTLV